MNRRLLLPLLVFLLGAAALAAAAFITFAPTRPNGQSAASGVGGPFTLTTADGKSLTDKDLRGAPFLVFFGFTHCPDICPTKLFEISEVLRAAGAKGDKLKALFVTVDPERDTPETMKSYLGSFDPRILGLTGDLAAAEPGHVRCSDCRFSRSFQFRPGQVVFREIGRASCRERV